MEEIQNLGQVSNSFGYKTPIIISYTCYKIYFHRNILLNKFQEMVNFLTNVKNVHGAESFFRS
jgi:hypothetical protein